MFKCVDLGLPMSAGQTHLVITCGLPGSHRQELEWRVQLEPEGRYTSVGGAAFLAVAPNTPCALQDAAAGVQRLTAGLQEGASYFTTGSALIRPP